MDANETLREIRCEMEKQGISLLLAFHDGAHFIEKPNPVMVLTGFKSLGQALVILPEGEAGTLFVTPAWDAERAAKRCAAMRSSGTDNILSVLQGYLEHHQVSPSRVGTAGLAGMPWRIGEQVNAMLHGEARSVDRLVFERARRKTSEQLSKARIATQIAEKGYERLRQIARPGMREDELAVELKWHMKMLGAEDNFLMLCAGPHNPAVQISERTAIYPRRLCDPGGCDEGSSGSPSRRCGYHSVHPRGRACGQSPASPGRAHAL
jgi:Xaa-Pro aminopeptidase